MAEKYLSEREAARVLEMAAKLQEASRDGAEGYSPGISVAELARIAAEAGIDPKFLDQALAEPIPPDVRRSFLGQVEERESVLEGELTEDGWDELNEYLASTGKFITTAATSRTKSIVLNSSWLANSKLDITSRKGRTRVKLRQPAFMAYFLGLHTPVILSVSLGVPLLASRAVGLGVGLAIIVGLLTLGILLYSYFLRVTRTKGMVFFDGLVDVMKRHTVMEEASYVSTSADKPDSLHQTT